MGLQRSRKERACHTIGRRLHTHVEPGMLLPRAWRRVRAWLAKTIKKNRRTPRALKESYPAYLCTPPLSPGPKEKFFLFLFFLFLVSFDGSFVWLCSCGCGWCTTTRHPGVLWNTARSCGEQRGLVRHIAKARDIAQAKTGTKRHQKGNSTRHTS